MAPEILLGAVAGQAIVMGVSFYVGWRARGASADAIEKHLLHQLDGTNERIKELKADAVRQRDASRSVLNAVSRRADHDPDSDPLGLGLLRGGDGAGQAPPSSGEAEAGDV